MSLTTAITLYVLLGVIATAAYFAAKPRYDRAPGWGKILLWIPVFAFATVATLFVLPLVLVWISGTALLRVVRLPYVFTAGTAEQVNREILRAVPSILLTTALISSVFSLIVNRRSDAEFTPWLEGWLQNFSTEMFGAYLTFLLLEGIIARQERSTDRRDSQIRAQFRLRQAADQVERQHIIDEMHALDLARGADFSGLDLSGIRLAGMRLDHTQFTSAALQGADFSGARLLGTRFAGADLRKADFSDAHWIGDPENPIDLTGAWLEGAAIQERSHLRDSAFSAQLFISSERGIFSVVRNSLTIILPDGSRWAHDNTLDRFTDPRHPEFWSPPAPPKQVAVNSSSSEPATT